MKPCDRATYIGWLFTVIAGVAVRYHQWTPAVCGGLFAIYWFLLMAARIVREGE